jgi:hypothetical protein
MMGDRLLPLLPSIIRGESRPDDPLAKTLAAFEAALALVEATIGKGYDDSFIETCDPRLLSYLGDLIGYQSVLDAGYGKTSEDAADAGNLRRDIARTIWLRRRKGTPAAPAAALKAATGWHSVVFENSRNVVTAASVRLPSQVAGRGLPDFRALVRLNNPPNPPPETVSRVATLRRIDAQGERGRWHPQDVVLEAWPRRAYQMHDVTPLQIADTSYWSFSPIGLDTQLYGPADMGDCPPVLVSAAPVHLHGVAGPASNHPRIYGEGRAMAVKVRCGETLEPLDPQWVTFGPVGADHACSKEGGWVIDPDSGRILPPLRAPEFLVRYYYEFGGDVGGGAYRQGIAPPANLVIADSLTHAWGALQAEAKKEQSTSIVAGPSERPTVFMGDCVLDTESIAFEGLMLVCSRLIIGPNVMSLVLRDCTIVDSKGNPAPIVCEPRVLEDTRGPADITIERSIFGGLSAADPSRVRLKPLSHCIVQPHGGEVSLLAMLPQTGVNSTVFGAAPLVGQVITRLNSIVPSQGQTRTTPVRFESERYGTVGYAQPADEQPDASRESGAFRPVSRAWMHRAMDKRLAEYVPLEARAGIILSTH